MSSIRLAWNVLRELVAAGLVCLRVARLKPGDVVIVKIGRPITPECAHRLRTQLEPIFPDNRVLVIDSTTDRISIVRGEPRNLEREDVVPKIKLPKTGHKLDYEKLG